MCRLILDVVLKLLINIFLLIVIENCGRQCITINTQTLLPVGKVVSNIRTELTKTLRKCTKNDPIVSSPPTVHSSQNKCENRKIVCLPTRYRTIDGTCNNLQRPDWGSVNMPYRRVVNNSYRDGVYEFPVSSSGKELPNARVLSREIFRSPIPEIQDPDHTLITMQFGQIVAHDLSLTAGISQTLQDPIPCCVDGKFLDPASRSPRCKPISRPADDPATVQEGNVCINFARTLSTKDDNCTSANEPSLPISSVTAYLDGSFQYGHNDSESRMLREGRDGRLLTVKRNGHDYPPQNSNVTGACAVTSPNEPCYRSGDVRINQNPQLSLLQVVFIREHNRIADELKRINKHWDDDVIFQEARRIFIACLQRIIYYEYLIIHLGYDYMIKEKLIYPNPGGHVNDYNNTVPANVLTEFSAAAFRYFHTEINGHLTKINEDRKETGSVRLSDAYVKPSILEVDDNFTKMSRGMCTQTANDNDRFLSREITDYFFRLNSTYGDDVRAIDIERCRDFGVGSYINTRAMFDLPTVSNFDDLKNYISPEIVEKLKSFYEDIKDIELLVAGSLELQIPDATVGLTFQRIIAMQFYNSRVGDRFFFENGCDENIAFTKEQLQAIHKVSLSRIMCDNTDIKNIQRRVFEVISEKNPLVSCKEIPSLDISLWKNKRSHNFIP